MSAAVADLARQSIDGQTRANRLLHELRAGSESEALHVAMLAVIAASEPEQLRSFARTLQRGIEAGLPGSGAGRALAGALEPAKQDTDADIFARLDLGICILCGVRIRLHDHGTLCPNCAGWTAWADAHQAASTALRSALERRP